MKRYFLALALLSIPGFCAAIDNDPRYGTNAPPSGSGAMPPYQLKSTTASFTINGVEATEVNKSTPTRKIINPKRKK